MKMLIFLILLIPAFQLFSQSQSEMNIEAYQSYQKADDELNKVYQSVLSEYKADSVFIENLKVSQRIWIKFRDAQLKVKFPDKPNDLYGSVRTMCISSYLEELTRDRIAVLKEWLTGIEEGDVCTGSVKIIIVDD